MKIGRLAPWYRWIEYAAFGHALEKRRFAFLPYIARLAAESGRVLVLGEGDGRTLAQLLKLAPLVRVEVVDVSPEMIALARRRSGDSDRVTFRCEDALTVDWPSDYYDAIVTNFFLDCFTEADARGLIRRLASALTGQGIWLIGEFAIPSGGWRRVHAQVWIWTMYRFFGLTTGLRAQALPPVERLLREAGMRRIGQETSRAGLVTTEAWRR